MDGRCDKCRWWHRPKEWLPDADGECRRYPPKPTPGLDIYGESFVCIYWPATDEDDFCGEFGALTDAEKGD